MGVVSAFSPTDSRVSVSAALACCDISWDMLSSKKYYLQNHSKVGKALGDRMLGYGPLSTSLFLIYLCIICKYQALVLDPSPASVQGGSVHLAGSGCMKRNSVGCALSLHSCGSLRISLLATCRGRRHLMKHCGSACDAWLMFSLASEVEYGC